MVEFAGARGQPIRDTLVTPVGTLAGPNWFGPAHGRAASLAIQTGGGAASGSQGTLSASGWIVAAGIAGNVFVRMAALPSNGNGATVQVGWYQLAQQGGLDIAILYTRDSNQFTAKVTYNGGTISSTPYSYTAQVGDWLGINCQGDPSHNGDDLLSFGFARGAVIGGGSWTDLETDDGLLNSGPYPSVTGMIGYIETNDATVRLTNFGVGELPNTNLPLVHGHGAC